jgi:putative membrane protein
MVTWFAGLFYLPRLYVYHADTSDRISHERFVIMEKRLFGIMTIGAVLTAVFGVALLWIQPWLVTVGWFQAKLALLALLVGYHWWCRRLMLDFRHERNTRDQRWYRWFNEAPSVLLIAIVVLAVVKPF